jgi:nucleoside-diphosphate-sugar epimerase
MNVAGGRRASLNELLALVGELTGREVSARYLEPRVGDVRDSLADLQRAEDLLGYRPQVGLREGLARTVEYFTKRRAEGSPR